MAIIESKSPAAADTVYAIGSMTKQFTAAAILQLADAGALNLDADIHELVPEYPAHQPAETLRNLLAHTSGIPDYFPTDAKDLTKIYQPISEADMIARFANSPLDFQPGSGFAYSNSNFYLLGVAIERASGEPYNTYLQRHIFGPLGLDIFACGSPDIKAKMAQGYLPDSKGGLVATPDIEMSWAFAAGDLCAATSAILAWNAARHRGNFLSDSSYSLMTTPALLADGTETTYGTGLFVDNFQGHRHFEHGGDTLTFSSQEAYYPDDDLSIVILTNTEGPFDRFLLEREIGREVLGLATPSPSTLPVSAELSAKFSGAYDIPGREVFPAKATTIATHDNQTRISFAGKSLALNYEGNGRFALAVPSAQLYLVFPNADGVEPFYSLLAYEMLVARGMRVPSTAAWLPNVGESSHVGIRPALHEVWLPAVQ